MKQKTTEHIYRAQKLSRTEYMLQHDVTVG